MQSVDESMQRVDWKSVQEHNSAIGWSQTYQLLSIRAGGINNWLPSKKGEYTWGGGLCLACIWGKGACTTKGQRSEYNGSKYPAEQRWGCCNPIDRFNCFTHLILICRHLLKLNVNVFDSIVWFNFHSIWKLVLNPPLDGHGFHCRTAKSLAKPVYLNSLNH